MIKDLTIKQLLKQFPFPTIRKIQEYSLRFMYDAIQNKYKYTVLELPTGTGKSAIGITFASMFDKVTYITGQKSLQDQYAREFKDHVQLLKGRSNYTCGRNKKYNCSKGPCVNINARNEDDPPSAKRIIAECIESGICPYYTQLRLVECAHIGLFNIHSLYFQSCYAGRFLDRDIVIIDEAHLLESTFMSLIEVEISKKYMEKLDVQKTLEANYIDVLKMLASKCALEIQFRIDNANCLNDDLFDHLNEEELITFSKKLENALKKLNDNPNNWVGQFEKNMKGELSFKVKPIKVGEYIKEWLDIIGNRVVFMSGTILSIPNFCKNNGIDVKKTKYIRATSPFAKENRAIKKIYVGSMSYKNRSATLPKMLECIRTISEMHKNERGIIFTQSYANMKAIQEFFKGKQRFTYRVGDMRDVLGLHSEKSNSILVGPAMEEGLDLKDTLCRFQILMKVPYPSLGDNQVSARFKQDHSWFNYVTLLKVIQAYGRSVRHENDHAVTYLLDSDFGRLFNMSRKMIPDYFSDVI